MLRLTCRESPIVGLSHHVKKLHVKELLTSGENFAVNTCSEQVRMFHGKQEHT